MYNIYSEEKKLLESDKKQREKEENIIYDEKHREKTNILALNYQKRIRKIYDFIFSTNPTSCKLNRNINFGKIASINIIENNKNPNKHQYQHRLLKSKSQQDLLSQPILRFKNRTDLERIEQDMYMQ